MKLTCRRRQLCPGTEFVLQEVQEPHLCVIKRQYRSAPGTTTTHAVYYILEGGACSLKRHFSVLDDHDALV